MKISQLRHSLDEYRLLLDTVGASEEAKGVDQFVEMFDGHESKTVAAFVKKIQKGRKVLGRD